MFARDLLLKLLQLFRWARAANILEHFEEALPPPLLLGRAGAVHQQGHLAGHVGVWCGLFAVLGGGVGCLAAGAEVVVGSGGARGPGAADVLRYGGQRLAGALWEVAGSFAQATRGGKWVLALAG